ncbi:transposon Tf2-6 polyprotein, partial [Nephila pilipes]
MVALRGEIAALSKQVERLSRDRSRNRSRTRYGKSPYRRHENITADSLSRIASIEMPNPINYDEIAKSQESDLELQNLINNPQGLQLKKIVMPNSDIPLFCDLSTGTARPYIPKEYRQRIFSQLHNMSHP